MVNITPQDFAKPAQIDLGKFIADGGLPDLLTIPGLEPVITSTPRTLPPPEEKKNAGGQLPPASAAVTPVLNLGSITAESVLLIWNGIEGQLVEWEVSTNSGFTQPVGGAVAVMRGTTANVGTQTVTGLKPGTNYFARARRNNAGKYSSWSSVKGFTTAQAKPQQAVTTATPAVPVLSDVAQVTSTSVALAWNPLDGSTTEYEVSTNVTFSAPEKRGTATGSGISVMGLAPNTKYHARIRRVVNGKASAWTGHKVFYTTAASGGSTTTTPDSSTATPGTAAGKGMSKAAKWGWGIGLTVATGTGIYFATRKKKKR